MRRADVDETPRPGERPEGYALRVARGQGHGRSAPRCAGARRRRLLGADTVVVVDGQILGKPAIWTMRGGCCGCCRAGHTTCITASQRSGDGDGAIDRVTTRVWFGRLDESDIAWYVASGEPREGGRVRDSGPGGAVHRAIDGSWSNVVGLPVATVHRAFAEPVVGRLTGLRSTVF